VTFALGALVPLLPYLLGSTTLWWSLLLSGLALIVTGAAVAQFTGRSRLAGAVRHLLLGGIAVGVVFGVGYGIGAGVSG